MPCIIAICGSSHPREPKTSFWGAWKVLMADQIKYVSSRSPLAYDNGAFLKGPDGRPLRILAEYLEPLARFRREKIQDTVVFFGSARFISLDNANAAARRLNGPAADQSGPEHAVSGISSSAS